MRIVVAGAGALGCFVGGLLAAAGRNVTLLARTHIGQEIRAHGLTLTDFNGMAQKVDADVLEMSERPDCLAQADIILITVKSGDTPVMARTIAAHAAPTATIISLQNDAKCAEILHRTLPDYDVRAGMVPFDVVPMGQGCFHRATNGDIVVSAGPVLMSERLSLPDMNVVETGDVTGLQWGKFLADMNNALNALSGLTLQKQLRDAGWRRLMADQWVEALRVLKASKIRPVSDAPISVGLTPLILRLPTPAFTRVAAYMLAIDTQARTSMAHDLNALRKTEIHTLQGQVIRMGRTAGIATPISKMVVDVVELAETAGQGQPNLPVTALRREIRS